MTTSNHDRFVNSHLLQFIRAHAYIFLTSCVFTNRCLVAASNGGRSPSSGFPNFPGPQLPASNSNSSRQLNPSGYLTNTSTSSSLNNSADVFVSVGVPTWFLLGHSLATAVVCRAIFLLLGGGTKSLVLQPLLAYCTSPR
jgi:hypothetical protein